MALIADSVHRAFAEERKDRTRKSDGIIVSQSTIRPGAGGCELLRMLAPKVRA
jgi:hypothetical protein